MKEYNLNNLLIAQYPRISTGWLAGGTIVKRNGEEYFLQCAGDSNVIGKRDINTGQPIGGFIHTDIPVEIHDVTYDPHYDLVWCALGKGLNEYRGIRPEIWKTFRRIARPALSFGVSCDPTDAIMWVADQEQSRIVCVSTDTGEEYVRGIDLPFKPCGIVKYGEYFLATRAGNPGDIGKLMLVNTSGEILVTVTFPKSDFGHDLGGMDIDSEGRLWLVGGKNTAVYVLDISKIDGEVNPPAPTPPEPTPPDEDPETPDTIKDILSRLENLESAITEIKEAIEKIKDMISIFGAKDGE